MGWAVIKAFCHNGFEEVTFSASDQVFLLERPILLSVA